MGNMISFPTILLRLSLAMILGALVGLERELREHEAGMRTNALVSLGSCLFTLISGFGFLDLLGIPHIQFDPSRIASYIVAGIGFLGAGSIFLSREENKVKGLTTAAAIWLVAGIGMACGAGLLAVAAAATILGLLILVMLRFIEQFSPFRKSSSSQYLKIEATPMGGQLIAQIYDTLARSGIKVGTLDIRTEKEVETVQIACHISGATTLAKIIGELRALPGIRVVQARINNTDKENANAQEGKTEG
jgi:putative Mg2+ transporter-C (MgtC) family protein